MTVGVKLLIPKLRPDTVIVLPPLAPRLKIRVEPLYVALLRYDATGASNVKEVAIWLRVEPSPIPVCWGAPALGFGNALSEVAEIHDVVLASTLVLYGSAEFCR